MKIAIVDDIKEERTSIRLVVEQYFKAQNKKYDLTTEFVEFGSGEAFLKQFVSGDYTLVFLDIYMDELTGIDVAKRIAALDKSCSIIFFTTSDDHQLEGYGVHAAGYILKPVSDHLSSVYNAMDYVMEKLQPDTSGISFHTDYGDVYIYYRDILYFDCIDRKIYLQLANKVIPLSGKYTDYSSLLLTDSRFLECYRNIIVNMDFIDSPIESDFILKNGHKLPISRRKKTDVMESYIKYFINRGGRG